MVVHPNEPRTSPIAAVLGKPFGPNPERGRLPHAGRREDVGEGPLRGRRHRRLRRGARPAEPARRLRRALAGAAPALGAGERRARLLALRVARRRRHVEEARRDEGLPEGIWGKVGVAVAPSDPQRVYALIEAEKGGLFRSDDGGETWSLASGHRALRQRAWYYSTLTVDPKNPDVVWFPQVPMLKTVDGGKTIKSVKGTPPRRPPRRVDRPDEPEADDRRRTTAGWTSRPTAARPGTRRRCRSRSSTTWPPTPRVPYRVFGAMQDLGTASGPSNSLSPRRHRARRLVHGGRRRGRPRGGRPVRPGRRLRRRVRRHPHPLRPPHAPGAQRRPSGRTTPPGHGGVRPRIPLPVDGPDRDLAPRPEDRLPRRQRALPHAGRRADAGRRSAAT